MWNFITNLGHSGHHNTMGLNQKQDFGFHAPGRVPLHPIVPGKAFSNPNFVNKHHPNVHNPRSAWQRPKSQTDISDAWNIESAIELNSSPIQSPIEPVRGANNRAPEGISVGEREMCSGARKRSKKSRKSGKRKGACKNSKRSDKKQQIIDMMEIDEESQVADVEEVGFSPKKPFRCDLADFVAQKQCESESKENCCDEMGKGEVSSCFVSAPPPIGDCKARSRQVSIAESEDSFIVFDDGTDDELDFSRESFSESDSDCSSDSESETDLSDEEDEEDSPSSVVPSKRVRFADRDGLCEVHPMVHWSFAYQQARKGPWEELARDRDRFRKRISELDKVLAPVCDRRHREKVYGQRFREGDV